jgi:hypothetical protein
MLFIWSLAWVVCVCQATLRVDKEWAGGFEGTLQIPIEAEIKNGWKIEVQFDRPMMVDVREISMASLMIISSSDADARHEWVISS